MTNSTTRTLRSAPGARRRIDGALESGSGERIGPAPAVHRRGEVVVTGPDAGEPVPLPTPRHDLTATSDERRTSGKLARQRVRRGTLGDWREEQRGHDALGHDPGPEPDPGSRARSPPAPANGGLSLELLPGRGGGHGRRSRIPAPQRAGGAALWRRARPQLRTVGDARAEPDVRPARLRRDAARSVRVGRQATGRQSGRRGRARERDQAGDRADAAVHGGGRSVSATDAAVHGDAGARHLVRRHCTSTA